MSWEDPLRKLELGTQHPAPSSVASSDLSSSLQDPDEWYQKRSEVLHSLDDEYFTPSGPEDDTAKVLRAFVQKLPKRGQLALMSEILLFKGEAIKLRQLRNFLVDVILKPMLAAGGKDPKTPLSRPTHPDAREEIGQAMSTIESSSRGDQAALKAACLRRDSYRCFISKIADRKYTHQAPGSPAGGTECAHILPFALSKFNEQNAQETENKATIWWALHRYFPDLEGLIGPDTVNQPQNCITLYSGLHPEFGDFALCLEPMDDGKYRVCWLADAPCPIKLPQVVTPTSNEPSVPLPNPEYLRVHFRIAEILEGEEGRQKVDILFEKSLKQLRVLLVEHFHNQAKYLDSELREMYPIREHVKDIVFKATQDVMFDARGVHEAVEDFAYPLIIRGIGQWKAPVALSRIDVEEDPDIPEEYVREGGEHGVKARAGGSVGWSVDADGDEDEGHGDEADESSGSDSSRDDGVGDGAKDLPKKRKRVRRTKDTDGENGAQKRGPSIKKSKKAVKE